MEGVATAAAVAYTERYPLIKSLLAVHRMRMSWTYTKHDITKEASLLSPSTKRVASVHTQSKSTTGQRSVRHAHRHEKETSLTIYLR